jgi:hypothetical protein
LSWRTFFEVMLPYVDSIQYRLPRFPLEALKESAQC